MTNLLILDYQPPAAIHLMHRFLSDLGVATKIWWLTSWPGAEAHETDYLTWVSATEIPTGRDWAQLSLYSAADSLIALGVNNVSLVYGTWFPLTIEAALYGLSQKSAVIAGLRYQAGQESCSTCLAAHRPDIKAAYDYWAPELGAGITKSHFCATSWPLAVDLSKMSRLIEAVDPEFRAANILDLYGNLCLTDESVLKVQRPPVLRDHRQDPNDLSKVNDEQPDASLKYVGVTRRGWTSRRNIDYVDQQLVAALNQTGCIA